MKALTAALLSVLLLAGPASAQDQTPTDTLLKLEPANIPEATTDIHWDVPAGHYERKKFTELGNANALRTTLQIAADHPSREWLSRTLIELMAGTGPKPPRMNILFSSMEDGSYQVSITKFNITIPLRVGVLQAIKMNVPTSISIDWKDNGDVSVQIGDGPVAATHLAAPIQQVFVSTASNEVKFSPFVLAHIK